MKDWQLFILLSTIYAAPHLPPGYARVCSVVFALVAIGSYYFWGAA